MSGKAGTGLEMHDGTGKDRIRQGDDRKRRMYDLGLSVGNEENWGPLGGHWTMRGRVYDPVHDPFWCPREFESSERLDAATPGAVRALSQARLPPPGSAPTSAR
jgi:hypothetical protein